MDPNASEIFEVAPRERELVEGWPIEQYQKASGGDCPADDNPFP
jgi:hypothetical protein